MHALVFHGEGCASLRDVPEPAIQNSHEVKLAPLACGVCGTDLHILAVPQSHPGTPGVVLGHEFVADVVEVGADVVTVSPGDRVVVRPIITCGACEMCLLGRANLCSNQRAMGVTVDGGLAEFVIASDTACVRIDSRVPLQVAALAEPLACVLSGVAKAAPRTGESAVIFGAGAAGLLYLAVLRASGIGRVVVVEPSTERAAVARTMGAAEVIDPMRADAVAEVRRVLGDGADIVVDAVGSQLGVAMQVAGRRGRIVLFGMNTHAESTVKQHLITERELQLLGSFVGQYAFPEAIRTIESGVIDFSPIVSHEIALDDLAANLAAIRDAAVVKAIIMMPRAS